MADLTTSAVTHAEQTPRQNLPGWLTWNNAFWLLLAGLTLVFAYSLSNIHAFLSGDSVTQYSQEVVALLGGQGVKAFALDRTRGPFFPAVVAGVAWLLKGDVFVAGQIVEVAAYAFLLSAVFWVIRSVWDDRLAFLAAAGVGANAQILINGQAWLTDLPFAALTLLSLACMYHGGRRWTWTALAGGLLAGLAFDTRWNGAFLIGVAVVAVLLNPWRAPPSQRAGWLGLFGLGFLIGVLPFLVANDANFGSPFYNELNRVPLEASLVSPRLGPKPSLLQLILVDPVFFIPRYLQRVAWDGLIQVASLLPLALAVVVPAGALVLLRRLDRRQLLLIGFTGIFWSIAALTHFEPRYYFPMLALLLTLPWVFLLSNVVPDILLRSRLSLKLCVLAAALAIVSAVQIQDARRRSLAVNASFQPQVEAAQLLADPPAGSVPGTVVAAEYYSGARYFIPHYAHLPTAFLKAPGDYLDPPAKFSHILAEQGVPQSFDPSDFFNPLVVSTQLEAMYFKPEAPKVVLYQIIRANTLRQVQAVTVTASLDAQHGPPALLDPDPATGWLTPASDSADGTAAVTVDLGVSLPIDRIWLLPPANAALFPARYRLEVSTDGVAWTQVAAVDHEPANQHQNPRAFAIPTQLARYVRFSAEQLRPGLSGHYQAGLNGIRVSLSGMGPVAAK